MTSSLLFYNSIHNIVFCYFSVAKKDIFASLYHNHSIVRDRLLP
jgi:hypothetical protein